MCDISVDNTCTNQITIRKMKRKYLMPSSIKHQEKPLHKYFNHMTYYAFSNFVHNKVVVKSVGILRYSNFKLVWKTFKYA